MSEDMRSERERLDAEWEKLRAERESEFYNYRTLVQSGIAHLPHV
jgi:hypothetical protein